MTMVTPKTIVITSLPARTTMTSRPIMSAVASLPPAVTEGLGIDGGVKKRKRLTNLSTEERMMRRKLKNRVAAQTARDRKKQRMEELEVLLSEVEAENKKLQSENMKLKKHTNNLSQENTQLRERLGLPGCEIEVKNEPLSPESAAGAEGGSLLDINDIHSAPTSGSQSDVFLGLLEDLDQLEASPAASPPPTERALPAQPLSAPHVVVGPTPAELESLNELIRFDHVYVKSVKADNRPIQPKPTGLVSVLRPVKVKKEEAPVVAKPTVQEAPLDLNLGDVVDLEALSGSLEQTVDFDTMFKEVMGTDLSIAALSTPAASNKRKHDSAEQSSQATVKKVKTERDVQLNVSVSAPSTHTITTPDPLECGYTFDFESCLLNDSGYSDEEAVSPRSDLSSPIMPETSAWEESFTELFPSLM